MERGAAKPNWEMCWTSEFTPLSLGRFKFREAKGKDYRGILGFLFLEVNCFFHDVAVR